MGTTQGEKKFESPAEALREAIKLYLKKNPDRILVDSSSGSSSSFSSNSSSDSDSNSDSTSDSNSTS